MIAVADASALIFLAKNRRLSLLRKLLTAEILVPQAVCKEVLAPAVEPAERRRLEAFLGACETQPVPHPTSFARAMSAADNAALSLAVRRQADILLCDERLTRAMAEAEGIRPLGTLGVLLWSLRRSILSPDEVRRLVDQLVQDHSFRIGIEVYRAVIAEIDSQAS